MAEHNMNWVFNTSLDKIRKNRELEDAHTFFDNTFGRGGNPERKMMQRADTVMQGLELAGMAAGAYNSRKNPKDLERESKSSRMVARQYEQEEEPMKMAAGAEGQYYPKSVLSNVFTPKQSLKNDTSNLSAGEFKKLKDGFSKAGASMSAGFSNFNVPLEEFELDNGLEKVPANDAKAVAEAKSGRKALMLEREDKLGEMKGHDLMSFTELRNLGRKLIGELRKKPTEYIDKPKPVDTSNLKESVRNKDGTVNVKQDGKVVPYKQKSKVDNNRIVENSVNFLNKTINMMDWLRQNQSELADEIGRRLWRNGDLQFDSLDEVAQKKLRGQEYSSRVQKAKGKDAEKIKSEVSDPIQKKLAETFEWQFDEKDMKAKLDKLGFTPNGTISKAGLASLLAFATSQFLFADEDEDEELGKKYDNAAYEGVSWNAQKLNGPEAKMAIKHGTTLINDWLDTFDESDMKMKDVETYNEIKRLMEDSKNGQNVLTNSGNTNPVAEILTNPKYYRMFQKYVLPLSKSVRGW